VRLERFASEAARGQISKMVAEVPSTGLSFERLRSVFVTTVA